MANPQARGRRALAVVRRHYWRPRYRPDQALSITTADGIHLAGAAIEGPVDAPATVVLVHGLTHSSRTPSVYTFVQEVARHLHVVVPDLRGHGDSGGVCTLGEQEPLDVAAAVAWARSAHPSTPVVTLGISLGGAVALLHAGDQGGVAGVVAVSSPAWWGAWETASTRRVHRYATTRTGRLVAAKVLRTRLAKVYRGVPEASALAAAIAPAFALIVADPADRYFGEEHPRTLFEWTREPKDLWMLPDTGHGTDLLTPEFTERLVGYLRERVATLPRSPPPHRGG